MISAYYAWRDSFLWQRLRLWLWLALIGMVTFFLRDVYNLFFPLREFQNLPEILQKRGLLADAVMMLGLGSCLALRKTNFGRRRPEILFLASSWSIGLVQQIFGTLNGFALPDGLAWSLLFFSQATFMPVRWKLHLISQLVILIYYFSVNTVLELKVLAFRHLNSEIYDVSFILYTFWLCLMCNLGVYLYDSLQEKEFCARRELETAYEKLEVTEAKYRNIFENAVEGIFQSTIAGSYITANTALARIYGYSSPEEVIAMTDIAHQLYVDPRRRGEFMRLIEVQGSISEFESQVYRRDGSIIWISEKAYGVRDAGGKLLYYEGLIEDITKRKQTEEALRVFFHAVSHDLRNPVLGSLMVLKNLANKDATESIIPVPRTIIGQMIQSSDRQLNLINSLMEAHFSEVQGIVLQRQTVQINTIAEEAIADLKPMLTENQAILINSISTDLPTVNADPTQLWRVFSNLIANAIKHNPPGLNITLNAKLEDDKVYCTVADDGVGISEQQSLKMFDLYFRGAGVRNSVSLGLGLYLCKQIIQAHGGEIGVKSVLGKGATFWFTLPIYD